MVIELVIMKVNDLKSDADALAAEIKTREAAKNTVAAGEPTPPVVPAQQ